MADASDNDLSGSERELIRKTKPPVVEQKDSPEVVMLKLTIAGMRSILRDCLAAYSHPQFIDRHGMADRIRRALNFTD